MELTLPGKLHKALEREAQDAKRTLHAHLVRKLENVTPPIDTIDPRPLHANLPRLTAYLDRVPGVRVLSSEVTPTPTGGSSSPSTSPIRWHGAWCRNWASC